MASLLRGQFRSRLHCTSDSQWWGYRIYIEQTAGPGPFSTAASMELRLQTPLCLSTVFLLGCVSPRVRADLHFESFDKKLLALSRVIDYIRQRPQQMNADATLGVTIAEGN